jgi:putative peptidoglycan lipid II flippase
MTDRQSPPKESDETLDRSVISDQAPVRSRPARLFAGLRVVSICTLLSRVLGLAREMAMAALFGLGPVLDAFTTAFAIPNLARALFGEGALSTAFLPLFVREQEQTGPEAANRLASAVFLWVALGLSALVAVGELLIAAALWLLSLDAATRLWLVLTSVMLPYLMLICLTAQIGSVLNAQGRFALPALLPVLFNVCSLIAIGLVRRQSWPAETQALWLGVAVVLTGIVQVVAPWPQLRRLGFRFDRRWREAQDRLRELLRVMAPIVLGLSITQLNVLCDRLIALGFSRPEAVDSTTSTELPNDGGVVEPSKKDWRPLESGTAAALNLGQRLYQFPLGLLGVALGTVIFPLLTRHAERGDLHHLREDLTLGLRLVFVMGIPASAGLWLLADPLAGVLFQRGNFDAHDARRTADMIACYGVGVWAFCGLLIVQRGFYAMGDRRTPLKIGLFVMLINLALNLTLIWVVGARGLALSTSICGILQFGLCLLWIQHRIGALRWWSLASHWGRTLIGTAAMTAIGWWILQSLASEAITATGRLVQLCVTVFAAIVSFAILCIILRLDEFWMLFRHPRA